MRKNNLVVPGDVFLLVMAASLGATSLAHVHHQGLDEVLEEPNALTLVGDTDFSDSA